MMMMKEKKIIGLFSFLFLLLLLLGHRKCGIQNGLDFSLGEIGCPKKLGLVRGEDDAKVWLGNGYVCVEITNLTRVTSIVADFQGLGQYGNNVLMEDGIGLKVDGQHVGQRGSETKLSVLKESGTEILIEIDHVGDHTSMEEKWTIGMESNARVFTFALDGKVASTDHSTVLVSFDFMTASLYAWYGDETKNEPESVVQMMNGDPEKSRFPSLEPLVRYYSLGGEGWVPNCSATDASIDIVFPHGTTHTILKSEKQAGLEILRFGQFPSEQDLDKWVAKVDQYDGRWQQDANWNLTLVIGANNFDFPVTGLGIGAGDNLVKDDLHAFLMGIYGSPAGNFHTHINTIVPGQRLGQMATSLAAPRTGYENNFNFFDPDDYIATAPVIWSHDPFLLRQVRMVLERSGDFLHEGTGQLPHHFQGGGPVYQALSGQIQTGPNVFWILSCFNYAKHAKGGMQWLQQYMDKLRFASRFLFSLIDPHVKMASVPGSLMIDVFLRSNFTTDTNAQLVDFFREFAEAEEALGNTTGAQVLRQYADEMEASVNQYLWQEDHFVTQWNYPENTTRDFIDYDANYIATAHGLVNQSRAEKIFALIDRSKCGSTTATYVSAIYYGKDDTQGGNVGDSDCAMGRIAWFNALGRKRFGDKDGFEKLLTIIQRLLLRHTFMHERLRCDGEQDLRRTKMYFEYPAVTAMMIFRIKYGIHIGFQRIEVAPFGPVEFSFHYQDMDIEFHPEGTTEIHFKNQPSTSKSFHLSPMIPNAMYIVRVGPIKTFLKRADGNGLLAFEAGANSNLNIIRMHLRNHEDVQQQESE